MSFRYLVILISLMLVACSSDEAVKKDEEIIQASAEELYNDGLSALQNKQYKDAIEKFEDIERTQPFSDWATRGQIMAAYGHYRQGDYDAAIAGLERFIKLHPAHPQAAYVFYLRAMCYYEQISDVKRDQEFTKQAQLALQEVVNRYSNTEYARDAKLKMDLVNDHLAGKEMEIGRYYQTRNEYVAAINRFKDVVENFDTTSHVPEALHRLTETYLVLGVKDEAQKYAAVLGHNFPDSPWYKRSYDLLKGNVPKMENESWLNKVF